MKKLWCGVLLLLLTSSVQATELKFNTQDFVPFNYKDEKGVAGPAADLIRKVCSEMHITCSFNLLPWTRAQMLVKNGKAHGMFVIGWNEARAKWLYFSPPILNTEYGFFVREDNPLQFKDIADIKSYKVAVYGPSNTSKSLEKIKAEAKDMTIDMRPDDESGFKKLSRGRVDAVFSNRDVGNDLVRKLGLKNIRYAGMQRKLQYYIGFSQQYTEKKIVDQFNTVLIDLYKNGEAQKILEQYELEPAEQK